MQIATIYLLAIKDKKIMVTALPVQQQTAGTLNCGVYNCHCFNLPFKFLVVIRALFLYRDPYTAHVCNQNGSTRK